MIACAWFKIKKLIQDSDELFSKWLRSFRFLWIKLFNDGRFCNFPYSFIIRTVMNGFSCQYQEHQDNTVPIMPAEYHSQLGEPESKTRPASSGPTA